MSSNVNSVFTVAIAGASSGLGAALALEYAAPGRRLFICARRKKLLMNVAEVCRQRGAEVDIDVVDVRSELESIDWVMKIDKISSIDLLIVNSGKFGGNAANRVMESVSGATDTIVTNLVGAVHVTAAMVTQMRERGAGHIALVSSLAAYYPQADAAAYSASKAGLTAYGEALREFLAPEGILISLIHPGDIATAQTEGHRGWMPMIMSREYAAHLIKRGLEAKRANIDFPFILRFLIWLNRFLPWQLRAVTNRPFRFHVDNSGTKNSN